MLLRFVNASEVNVGNRRLRSVLSTAEEAASQLLQKCIVRLILVLGSPPRIQMCKTNRIKESPNSCKAAFSADAAIDR